MKVDFCIAALSPAAHPGDDVWPQCRRLFGMGGAVCDRYNTAGAGASVAPADASGR
jgi:hypothetical protein